MRLVSSASILEQLVFSKVDKSLMERYEVSVFLYSGSLHVCIYLLIFSSATLRTGFHFGTLVHHGYPWYLEHLLKMAMLSRFFRFCG